MRLTDGSNRQSGTGYRYPTDPRMHGAPPPTMMAATAGPPPGPFTSPPGAGAIDPNGPIPVNPYVPLTGSLLPGTLPLAGPAKRSAADANMPGSFAVSGPAVARKFAKLEREGWGGDDTTRSGAVRLPVGPSGRPVIAAGGSGSASGAAWPYVAAGGGVQPDPLAPVGGGGSAVGIYADYAGDDTTGGTAGDMYRLGSGQRYLDDQLPPSDPRGLGSWAGNWAASGTFGPYAGMSPTGPTHHGAAASPERTDHTLARVVSGISVPPMSGPLQPDGPLSLPPASAAEPRADAPTGADSSPAHAADHAIDAAAWRVQSDWALPAGAPAGSAARGHGDRSAGHLPAAQMSEEGGTDAAGGGAATRVSPSRAILTAAARAPLSPSVPWAGHGAPGAVGPAPAGALFADGAAPHGLVIANVAPSRGWSGTDVYVILAERVPPSCDVTVTFAVPIAAWADVCSPPVAPGASQASPERGPAVRSDSPTVGPFFGASPAATAALQRAAASSTTPHGGATAPAGGAREHGVASTALSTGASHASRTPLSSLPPPAATHTGAALAPSTTAAVVVVTRCTVLADGFVVRVRAPACPAHILRTTATGGVGLVAGGCAAADEATADGPIGTRRGRPKARDADLSTRPRTGGAVGASGDAAMGGEGRDAGDAVASSADGMTGPAATAAAGSATAIGATAATVVSPRSTETAAGVVPTSPLGALADGGGGSSVSLAVVDLPSPVMADVQRPQGSGGGSTAASPPARHPATADAALAAVSPAEASAVAAWIVGRGGRWPSIEATVTVCAWPRPAPPRGSPSANGGVHAASPDQLAATVAPSSTSAVFVYDLMDGLRAAAARTPHTQRDGGDDVGARHGAAAGAMRIDASPDAHQRGPRVGAVSPVSPTAAAAVAADMRSSRMGGSYPLLPSPSSLRNPWVLPRRDDGTKPAAAARGAPFGANLYPQAAATPLAAAAGPSPSAVQGGGGPFMAVRPAAQAAAVGPPSSTMPQRGHVQGHGLWGSTRRAGGALVAEPVPQPAVTRPTVTAADSAARTAAPPSTIPVGRYFIPAVAQPPVGGRPQGFPRTAFPSYHPHLRGRGSSPFAQPGRGQTSSASAGTSTESSTATQVPMGPPGGPLPGPPGYPAELSATRSGTPRDTWPMMPTDDSPPAASPAADPRRSSAGNVAASGVAPYMGSAPNLLGGSGTGHGLFGSLVGSDAAAALGDVLPRGRSESFTLRGWNW